MMMMMMIRNPIVTITTSFVVLLLLAPTTTHAKITAVPLPYDYHALEPHLSEQTLKFHYDKHYFKYVNTTNSLIDGTTYDQLSLEDIIVTTWTDLQDPRSNDDDKARAWKQHLFNNAAQSWNHGFYWKCLSPTQQQPDPNSALYQALVQTFGSLQEFGTQFTSAGNAVFGSGWAWLVCRQKDHSLSIVKTIGAENPMASIPGSVPLLTMDVWEHSYYIDYQNRRPDYTSAFWNHLVHWKYVEQLYDQCVESGRGVEL